MKKLIFGLVVFLFLFGVVGAFECSDADFDGDGVVDRVDIGVFGEHWQETGCADVNSPCHKFDLDDNGKVAGGDLGLWSGCYNASCNDMDFDNDQIVDRLDAGRLGEHWGEEGCLDAGSSCYIFDLDSNGKVAGGDLGLWAGCYKQSCNDADFNNDRLVDDGDVYLFKEHWEEEGCLEKGSDCYIYDLDNNGKVAGGDLGLFAACYNQGCQVSDFDENGKIDLEDISACSPNHLCSYTLFIDHAVSVDGHKIKLKDIIWDSSTAGSWGPYAGESKMVFEVDGEEYDFFMNEIDNSGIKFMDFGDVVLGVDSVSHGGSYNDPNRWEDHIDLHVRGAQCGNIEPRALPQIEGECTVGCGDGYCDFDEVSVYSDAPSICEQDCGANGEYARKPVCGDTFCDPGEGKANWVDADGEENSRIVCPEDCAGGFKSASWKCADGTEFSKKNIFNCDYSFSWEGYAKLACGGHYNEQGACGLDRSTLTFSDSCKPFWAGIEGWLSNLFN